jgi:hypothetical protein
MDAAWEVLRDREGSAGASHSPALPPPSAPSRAFAWTVLLLVLLERFAVDPLQRLGGHI